MRVALLAGLALAGIAGLAWHGPIPQDPAYHRFADARPFLGIPNFGDVASNLAFVGVGIAGLAWLSRPASARAFATPAERLPWRIHFLGQALTGIGSAYYHWAPADGPLFWDRLPLTFVITSLAAAVVGERIDARLGRRLLLPFLALGALSLVAWRMTGDLRAYGFVQFYPVAAIPLVLALWPARHAKGWDYLGAVGWYALAKVAEHLDGEILRALGGAVSGHTIKHLLAAVAGAWLLKMLVTRST